MERDRGKSRLGYLTQGLILDNPILILMIGLCPALATSVSLRDGVGMGIATSFVLIASNLVISSIRRWVPAQVRIPCFIVVISTFVTLVDYLLQAYQPDLYRVLGVFVPLIVVNCIILGRAEAFAYHHSVFESLLDGLGKAIGFTLVMAVMGGIRELLAQGTLLSQPVMPAGFRANPVLFMLLPPGAFLLIGFMKALIVKFVQKE